MSYQIIYVNIEIKWILLPNASDGIIKFKILVTYSIGWEDKHEIV